jgi:16S rRNA (guanine527-N7)-methyltransferase
MSTLSDHVISRELQRYGILSTSEISSAIRAYIPLMLHWNRKISLTTVTDQIEIVRFHFGESMFSASILANKNGRLADVGSGAGFPGIPLKLVTPTLEVVLIESNAKKASFLAEVIRELKIGRVEVYRGSFEGFDGEGLGFDYITARALGMHETLVNWARGAVKSGGSLILWLGERDAVQVARQRHWEWREPLLIPGSQRRTILAGTPAR